MSIRFNKKLFLDDNGSWKASISKPSDQQNRPDNLPDIFVSEIMYDGDVDDIVYDETITEDEDLVSALGSKYFSSVNYKRPATRAEMSSLRSREDLMTSLLDNVKSRRNFADTFSQGNQDTAGARLTSKLFNFGPSEVRPGLMSFKDNEFSTSSESYDSPSNFLEGALRVLQDFSKPATTPGYLPLKATIIPLTPTRDTANPLSFFPGDLLNLLVSGGSGRVISSLSGIERHFNSPTVHKVTKDVLGPSVQSVTDGAKTVNITINITLPANTTSQGGKDEEV
jgi:hypothetical protein